MNAYENYLAGNECLKKSDYISAIGYLITSNSLEPHFKTYEKLFLCYRAVGQIERAFDCISCSYELNRNNDKIALEYAEMLAEYKHNYAFAKEILLNVLQRNPLYKPAEKLINTIP
ncbi:MAG: hypothetical protein IJZ72_02700 [Oscillospiraceae bacterium]|nr:hypothetical protein [Oscillospiraceae bacterium]